MKKFFVPLFVFLLLSCSNEGFESIIAASAQKDVYCYLPKGNCLKISKNFCLEMGVEISSLADERCNPGSSSSEEVSGSSMAEVSSSSRGSSSSRNSSSSLGISSSTVVDVSSSSGIEVEVSSSSNAAIDGSSSSVAEVPSSSSIDNTPSSSSGPQAPEPVTNCGSGYTGAVNTCETFAFRNFHDIPGRGYYLDSTLYASNTSASSNGGSQLYHRLSITNNTQASCGEITIEIEGGGLTSIQYRSNGSNTPIASNPLKTAGVITARVVATCSGAKKILATANANAIALPPPSWSACSIPPYVGKNEPIADLKFISIENNHGRCNAITYSMSGPQPVTNLNLTTGTRDLSITARATCSGSITLAQQPCTKSGVTVVDNNVNFPGLDVERPISATGRTVIVLPEEFADKFGCKGVNNSSTFDFKLNGGNFIKGTPAQKEGNNWWVVTDIPANAASNGNRFLLDTNGEALQCLIATW